MLFSQAVADDGYWPKSYFVQVGYGAVATRGDLRSSILSIKDTAGIKGKSYHPDIEIMGTPDFAIGANIAQFTLALDFQYTTTSSGLAGMPEDYGNEDSRIWRLGFEFTYNIFWPEDFQIGLGGGYTYTSVKTDNSTFFDGSSYSAELMGSAVGVVANLHYYLTDHFAIAPSIKIYENWFKNIYTSRTENCDLDPYLWHTFVMAAVSLQYQF